MISVFRNSYACEVSDICVEIGPHILECHFEIQDDLVEIFSEYGKYIQKVEGRTYLQLQEVIKKQLLSFGVSEKNIQMSPTCTYCSDNYFSYRRDKPEIIEAMLAYIAISE
jgi:copper oxidase (laccase) domain-containing protein